MNLVFVFREKKKKRRKRKLKLTWKAEEAVPKTNPFGKLPLVIFSDRHCRSDTRTTATVNKPMNLPNAIAFCLRTREKEIYKSWCSEGLIWFIERVGWDWKIKKWAVGQSKLGDREKKWWWWWTLGNIKSWIHTGMSSYREAFGH